MIPALGHTLTPFGFFFFFFFCQSVAVLRRWRQTSLILGLLPGNVNSKVLGLDVFIITVLSQVVL